MGRRSLTTLALALGALAAARAQEAPRSAASPVLEKALPAVVKVYGAGGFAGIPAYGTGVVVDERGFILTAWSIALRTDQLKVVGHDGRRYPATVWRADPGLGVALLKATSPEAGFRALRLGDSRRLKAGDTVYALGNPFGVIYGDEAPAIQQGVVTAMDSPRREGIDVARLPESLAEVILTDVPNNPGTQGGPLLDGRGELVGILGRLVESRATNTILNYAVPAHALTEFVREGLASDRARPEPTRSPGESPRRGPRPFTGIRLLRAHMAREPMAYVEVVVRGSPAEGAGVQPDDLIFRAGGRTIRTTRDWDEALDAARPGQPFPLLVKRGGDMLRLELVPQAEGQGEGSGER